LQQPNHGHASHALPPQDICDLYKKYQKMHKSDLENDDEIIDFNKGIHSSHQNKLHVAGVVHGAQRHLVCEAFNTSQRDLGTFIVPPLHKDIPDCTIYEHVDFPGKRRSD
jgi:alkylated DNA repair protein alkB family protein 1